MVSKNGVKMEHTDEGIRITGEFNTAIRLSRLERFVRERNGRIVTIVIDVPIEEFYYTVGGLVLNRPEVEPVKDSIKGEINDYFIELIGAVFMDNILPEKHFIISTATETVHAIEEAN